MVLLEEAGKDAQEAAELGTDDLCREGLERPQRAAGQHNSAGEGRQHFQRRAEAGRRSAGRGADRRHGGNVEKQGRRFALMEPGREAAVAAELETAAHEKENGNKKALRIDARPER